MSTLTKIALKPSLIASIALVGVILAVPVVAETIIVSPSPYYQTYPSYYNYSYGTYQTSYVQPYWNGSYWVAGHYVPTGGYYPSYYYETEPYWNHRYMYYTY